MIKEFNSSIGVNFTQFKVFLFFEASPKSLDFSFPWVFTSFDLTDLLWDFASFDFEADFWLDFYKDFSFFLVDNSPLGLPLFPVFNSDLFPSTFCLPFDMDCLEDFDTLLTSFFFPSVCFDDLSVLLLSLDFDLEETLSGFFDFS